MLSSTNCPPLPQTDSSKRRRVSTACLACRGKRMRCDGQQPVCGPCTKRGVDCEYQHGENKRRTPSKKYVESLQSRISQLEAQLVSLGSHIATRSGDFNLPETEGNESHSEAGEDNSDPLIELTGRVGRLTVIDDGQLHYFGSQSSYNLIQEPSSDVASDEPTLRARRQGLAAAAQLRKLVAVPQELQEHLLELYWRWQNPWNYVVHKSTFLKSFREDDGKYSSPLLLSAIFAIAARYSDRPELCSILDNPSTAGEAFCEQAKILLLYESEAPTVTTVQAASLLALRLMSDGKEALGWLYCGNAVRMAYNLGLHLDCSKWIATGLVSEGEAKVRSVAWWGCYFVDKLFALGLGRPSSSSKSSITCPKPSIDGDEEFDPWAADPDLPDILSAHSYIASTSRYNSESMTIACEAMDIIYAANRKLSTREIEDIVSKTDVELQSYYRTLPSYLRLPASPKVPTLPHIYLFHIQYHAHMILLHKPLIKNRKPRSTASNNMSTETGSSNIDSHMNPHMVACRHSASEIARILRIYKQHYTLRRIPIAAVHLCFSAAVIHLIDTRPTNPNRQQAIRRLHTCVEALRDLRTAWCNWSNRALRAVQLMAREWYHCEDLSQLQHCCDDTDELGACRRREAAKVAGANDQCPAAAADTSGLIGGAFDADSLIDQNGGSWSEIETDPLAFLFDDSMLNQTSDDLIKDWIAEQGYDLFHDGL